MHYRFIRQTFCLLLFLLPAVTSLAQVNRQTCIDNLEQADIQLADGYFDEAIALLEPCRDLTTLNDTEQTRMFKLLADAYLAKSYVTEAREIIARILEISPNYTPDVNLDSQQFRNLVAELKSARTPPAAPENLVALVENDRVRLSWNVPGGDLIAIRIMRGGSVDMLSPIDSVGAGISTYTDAGAIPGETYFYALQSVSGNGLSSDNSAVREVTLPVEKVAGVPAQENTETLAGKSRGSGRKVLFIGGGVLVAGGIAAAIALSGGGGDDPPIDTDTTLPGPPVVP